MNDDEMKEEIKKMAEEEKDRLAYQKKIDAEVEKLLHSPKLLHYIKKTLDKTIYGEDRNKVLLWLIGLSAKIEIASLSLGAVIVGESSAGKSYILQNVTKLLGTRDIDILWFSRITDASLNYLEDQSLTGKILVVEELEGVGDNPQLRVMLSEHGLSLLTTKKEGGSFTQRIIKVEGCPAFFSCTTRKNIEDQLATRTFKISPDESQEQTKMIYDFLAKKEDIDYAEDDFGTRVIRTIIRSLKPAFVKVPFADKIAEQFPFKYLRGRRDFSKLLNLVKIIAWLYQYQRTHIDKLILADVIDLKYAIDILKEAFEQTFTGIVPPAKQLYEKIEHKQEVTVPELAVEFDMVTRTVRRYLNNLTYGGLLVKDDSKKPHRYIVKKELNASVLNGLADIKLSFSEKEYLESRNYTSDIGHWDEHNGDREYISLFSNVGCPMYKRGKLNSYLDKIKQGESVSPKDTEQKTLVYEESQLDRIKKFINALIKRIKLGNNEILEETLWTVARNLKVPEQAVIKIIQEYTEPSGDAKHLILDDRIIDIKFKKE